jgi:hypothetical protein
LESKGEKTSRDTWKCGRSVSPGSNS